MTLLICDEMGNVHEVEDDIEEYDLSKNMARVVVCDRIQRVIENIKKEKDEEENDQGGQKTRTD